MNGDRPRLKTQSAMALGMPRKAAALPRIEAPSTISAIIEQVVTEPMATSRRAAGGPAAGAPRSAAGCARADGDLARGGDGERALHPRDDGGAEHAHGGCLRRG